MIYEFRTYRLHPRAQGEFLKRFSAALEPRQKHSRLAAFWTTDIGTLNQVVYVWPYKDEADRERVREEAAKDGSWPPKAQELIADMKTEIFKPLPFSPDLEPSDNGPFFEMRSYTIEPGSLDLMSRLWQECLPRRLELSPLTAVLYREEQDVTHWVHIWAYKSMDQRTQVRKAAIAAGIWPPSSGNTVTPVTFQENRIMVPAPFSPIR